MRKSKKLLRNIIFIGIAVLIAMVIINQIVYHMKLDDEFYSSAIPNDLVVMGMKSSDAKAVLGKPEEEMVMMDYYQVNYGGNDLEYRETGEVVLTYDAFMFGESGTIQYSYYKPDCKVNHARVYLEGYETLEEATAMTEKLLEYAEEKFKQKGDYHLEPMDSVISCLTYRLKAEDNADTFIYEISVSDDRELGLMREKPYSINIYQNLFSK